jgi:hypothetical protein
MDFKDALLTPLYLVFIFLAVVLFARREKDVRLRKYFLWGFILKIIGSLSLGLIYQFYYSGGDTYNYYNDSKVVWDAFLENPLKGFELILAESGVYSLELDPYLRRMYFFPDAQSFNVVRVAGFFSFFTFNTYSLIAICFAIFSFTGMWVLYKSFYQMYPMLHLQLVVAVLFIPSIFFWGSGLLKDTLIMGALGWTFAAFYQVFIRRQQILLNVLVLIGGILVIKSIKVYILICFLPALLLWFFFNYQRHIRSVFVRVIITPLLLAMTLPASYFTVQQVTQESNRYSLDKLAYTTQETSSWLYHVSKLEGGSGYTLGQSDGSIEGMLALFPKAIFVTLYQPLLWQARNPVMLLSALEAAYFLWLTLKILWRVRIFGIFKALDKQPFVIACLTFSLVFSAGVGLASANFGTLVRYKIPMMPFFLTALYIIEYQYQKDKKARRSKRQSKRLRKFGELAITE